MTQVDTITPLYGIENRFLDFNRFIGASSQYCNYMLKRSNQHGLEKCE